MKKKNTLKSEDWIRGAFRALGAGGPQAIRVEAIARDMKVSKGSFYWHFKDLGTLKAAMLEHWVDVATFETIARIEQKDESAPGQLVALIELATGGQSADYGGPQVEAAIREWARTEKSVAQIVEKVEAARLDFVASLFLKAGAGGETSQQNARLLYSAMIGLEQLPDADPAQIRQDLGQLLERLVGNMA